MNEYLYRTLKEVQEKIDEEVPDCDLRLRFSYSDDYVIVVKKGSVFGKKRVRVEWWDGWDHFHSEPLYKVDNEEWLCNNDLYPGIVNMAKAEYEKIKANARERIDCNNKCAAKLREALNADKRE
jgi:hypothetical protein